MFGYSSISTALFYNYILPRISTINEREHWRKIIEADRRAIQMQLTFKRLQKLNFPIYEKYLLQSLEQDDIYLRDLETLEI